MADSFRRRGALRERLHFQARGDGNDGMGGVIPGAGAFATVHTVAAGMRPRTGGEAVTAARLGGRQPYIVTIRWAKHMLDITTAWQVVDARNANRVLNIVSPPADPDGANHWLEFLAEEGRPS
ncbi:head-tail adaptor [Devosia sp. UYZn731]|uniref:head-tail adaptor protein n=1 Tax=Devosia sp. UYZn731 TaxID=3156345 RepID=UPI0033924854